MRFYCTVQQCNAVQYNIYIYYFFVKKANVIKHDFAVLYKKPVVFLSSSDYSVNYKNSVHSFAKVLSKTPVDVSNPTNILTSFLEINDEAYKRYIDLFIKSPNTPQKFLWEIFADFIDSEESKRNPDFY